MEAQDHVAILQQFGRTYRAFLAAFEAHVGQPMPRWRILLALHDERGTASQKRLVELLRTDPGALTRQLKSLEALGWIARASDPRDNRVTNVTLTAAGREAFDECMPRRAAFLDETMSALPDDALSALSAALTLLEARIAEVGSAAAAETGEAARRRSAL
ncbi:MarR family winged helix-turn-helix transcriptional regulator [Burkholderia glumae]|uniref:MarR family transcriptional regulator n=1 Tax=Burkholderia glumae TaxID=337 RepID=A0AAP9Y0R8_BURGL|nr:MarR family transcriptional regulator [Burkholderia glumae]ACR30157.1 Transcriptional regulator, MarR family [Burkholderia glumae BGR1]AJY66286.1 winged helix DNA-binding domain protein [Burkholderia glumae LMG 2196 = ATCC 33617]KHJ60691.1 MarR family transcriptional regulator [Burkholderia glumae]MCM2482200.1 MarR family transcriptional regulator [Burkholderia glumae]MCM2507657.1 MarR family transcriptional regulator [Burkholderia glumae]